MRSQPRRDFLRLIGLASAAVVLPPWLQGCATDPVTGKTSLVGMSEDQEKHLDKQHAPHQFSADYGASQDTRLNRYVEYVGARMWADSHRPKMPYSARALNANYVNAYTFPAGSIGVTRGILLEMESEDELAALMGHEIGHVNARHAAERAGKSMLVQGGLVLAQVAVAGNEQYQPIIQLAGQIGGSALLAKYSRDDEREADALGMDYMVKAGYNPDGMSGLMGMLQSQSKSKPGLLETMFASHPMSDERHATAQKRAAKKYAAERGRKENRERYMDSIADLRRIKTVVAAQQQGEGLMSKKQLPQAEERFDQALRQAPDDYTGNVLMAKLMTAQKRPREAEAYLAQARAIYPSEGQALQLSGVNKLALNQPDAALQFFQAYEQRLPGNPNTTFLMGVAHEDRHDRKQAAQYFYRYAQQVNSGREAQYAVSRLKSWGYLK
ncbi:MAG: M48 family metalloprotease [Pseudomonadota bacterium]